MTPTLRQATAEDIPALVCFMEALHDEIKNVSFDKKIVTTTITQALRENVVWFLFLDEAGAPFGACHLQSPHNYWRVGRRFYLGGFYMAPSHRGRGLFRTVQKLLKEWVVAHGGVQILAHIHKENEKSRRAFGAVEFAETDYLFYVNHWGD